MVSLGLCSRDMPIVLHRHAESGNIPPGYTQESFFAVVLSALHNRLVADGLRSLVQIMAPNDGGISTASMLAALQWSVDTLDDYIDVYSSHDYSMSGYSSWCGGKRN